MNLIPVERKLRTPGAILLSKYYQVLLIHYWIGGDDLAGVFDQFRPPDELPNLFQYPCSSRNGVYVWTGTVDPDGPKLLGKFRDAHSDEWLDVMVNLRPPWPQMFACGIALHQSLCSFRMKGHTR